MDAEPSAHDSREPLAGCPGLAARLEAVVTPERTFRTFKRLADTYAPTLSARHTRGPVLQSLFAEARQEGLLTADLPLDLDYLRSGVAVACLGAKNAKAAAWSVAHLDNIGYLTGPRQADGYPLTPHCQSRQNPGQRPGVALDLSRPDAPGRVLARGEIVTGTARPGSVEPAHFFRTEAADLPLATRVCYATAAEWDRESDLVYGAIDNAACCASLALASIAVQPYRPAVWVLWPDEEEGVVDAGPPAFARATARLLHRLDPAGLPDLIFVSDILEMAFDADADLASPQTFGHGACLEGWSSATRGAVTPPRLLHALRSLQPAMAAAGAEVRETGRYVNRSDDVSLVMATPNIALLSCPGAYTHFQATPRASLRDVMHLARALAVAWMAAQQASWLDRFR